MTKPSTPNLLKHFRIHNKQNNLMLFDSENLFRYRDLRHERDINNLKTLLCKEKKMSAS